MNCRHCRTPLDPVRHLCLDLGTAPPSNAFLSEAQLAQAERYLPLRVVSCPSCELVQLFEAPERERLFNADYPYFSSVSQSWVEHARAYVAHALPACDVPADGLVVEVASNDGYLLQFVRDRQVRALGIEPTASTAHAARQRGIETLECFLGARTAHDIVSAHGQANLVVANNVLAHVPDVNDFVEGIRVLLAPGGTVTFEFPHLHQLLAQSQIDTIYHEHYSYLSLASVERILAGAGLTVWDVEQLPTHGGSLRVWAQHAPTLASSGEGGTGRSPRSRVQELREVEARGGLGAAETATQLQRAAWRIKGRLLSFLIDCQAGGKTVVGYGAAAKGNTLLNYAGVRADLLPWVADASPHKQGLYLPGSRIPVVHPDQLAADRPAYVLLLPWNLAPELTASLSYIREWGGQFVTAVPELRIV